MKRGKDIAILLLFVGCMLLINFFKSYNNLDVEGDGFIYLTFSKYYLLMGQSKLRTPLIAIFLIPDVHWARVEMMFFHLGISILIYALCMRYTESRRASLIAALLYGCNWWFVQFTTYTLMELPSVFALLFSLYLLPKKNIAAGVLQGFMFLLKPHYFFFILASLLMIKDRKARSKFILSFLIIAVFLEVLLDFVFYTPHTSRFVYSPWEFFHYNIIVGEDPILLSYKRNLSFSFIISRIMNGNPLTESILRWFLSPLVPLASLILSIKLKRLFTSKFMLAITFLYIIFNLAVLVSYSYEEFRPDKVVIPKTWNITSNYASMVSFYTGEGCCSFSDTLDATLSTLNRCKYLVLVKHPNRLAFYNEVKKYAEENFILIDSYREGIEIEVYENK